MEGNGHRPPLYGLMAEFDNPDVLREAAIRANEQGYKKMDAYSPFPVEGLSEAFHFNHKPVSLITLIGGILGGLSGFYLQYWIEAVNYPINVGGRPYDSIPSFIPVTFELTVLGAAIFGFVGMLALNGLPRPYHPVFHVPQFAKASRDGFFLCIESTDPQFEYTRTRELLESLGPISIADVPY